MINQLAYKMARNNDECLTRVLKDQGHMSNVFLVINAKMMTTLKKTTKKSCKDSYFKNFLLIVKEINIL